MKLSPPKNRYFAPTDNFKAGGDNFTGVAGTTFALLLHTKTATPLQYEKLSPLFAVRDIVPPPTFSPRGDNFKGVGGGDNFTGEGR